MVSALVEAIAVLAVVVIAVIAGTILFKTSSNTTTSIPVNPGYSTSATTLRTSLSTVTTSIRQTTYRYTFVMKEYSITPKNISAHTGDMIIMNVINNGTQVHNLCILEVYSCVGPINPGSNATLVFNALGARNYTYYSSYGQDAYLGIRGQIVVT